MEIAMAKTGLTETEIQAVSSSLTMIAGTPYGATPYLRDMGIREYLPDDASDLQKNAHIADVIEQIGLWEDRVEVDQITFDGNEMKVVVT